MKTLILVRHGKSSWDQPALADFDRPLLPRGQKDARLIGEFLAGHHLVPDVIRVSPALRARETARILADALGYPTAGIDEEPAIYEAAVSDLLGVLRATRNGDTLLMVGHNPGFSVLLNSLTDETHEDLPTCGTAVVEFNVKEWSDILPGSGRLRWLQRPKQLRGD
ncbi:MAG TPA: histidine phosphatase family protein [Thioalkalivibrio sp.]|nr:histidine phosphatase family protein [Thioalkalivibrio sp.]